MNRWKTNELAGKKDLFFFYFGPPRPKTWSNINGSKGSGLPSSVYLSANCFGVHFWLRSFSPFVKLFIFLAGEGWCSCMSRWLHHDSGLAIGCPFSGTKHTAWALPQGHSEAPLVQKVQVLAGSKPAASPSWALNPQIGAGKGRALQAGWTASRRWPSCNPSISFLEWIPWKLEEPSFFIYFFSFLSSQSHFIGDQRSLFPSAFPFIFVSPLATKCPGVELDSRRFHDLFF